jgi:hypothetical protein
MNRIVVIAAEAYPLRGGAALPAAPIGAAQGGIGMILTRSDDRRSRGRWPARRRLAVTVVATAALSAGCISSAPYVRVATAGTAYAGAVEKLATTGEALAVDASSARLLQDDALAGVDLATLGRFDDEDARRLAVLARLQTHARLLRRYFSLIGDLAAGRGGTGAAAAVAGVASALEGAGDALRHDLGGASVAASTEPVKAAAGRCGARVARDEIKVRAATLRRELVTEGELLAALSAAMRHDADLLAASRRQRLVVDPLLAAEPVADPERWMADRRTLLELKPRVDSLGAASRAARTLATALDGLGAGRLDLDRIDEVIADAETIDAALAGFLTDRGGA